MRILTAFASLFSVVSILGNSASRADDIQIEKVVGQVWYIAAGSSDRTLLKPLMNIPPGSIRTDLTSVLYATPRAGSKFRLAEGTTVEFESNGPGPRPGGGTEPVAVLELTQGKVTMNSAPGQGRYDIVAKGGKIGASGGLCVVCSHGDAAHVYVARGVATIYPREGQYRVGGLKLLARPTIAILNSNGVLETQPLSQAASGVVNCLLSGASAGGGGAVENGLPSPANLKGNPPVSETQ